MFSIYLHGPGGTTGYRDEELDEQLSAICERHRGSGRALAFAFILYNYQHPHIEKILEDAHYWNALDHLSGEYLTVFSFHVKGSAQHPRKFANSGRLPQRLIDPLVQANKVLEKYFGQPFTMPALLFFQVADSELVGSYMVGLSSRTVEDAFNEITSVLEIAVNSISGVTEENRGNAQEIFALIKDRLLAKRIRVRFYRMARSLTSRKELLSFLFKLH